MQWLSVGLFVGLLSACGDDDPGTSSPKSAPTRVGCEDSVLLLENPDDRAERGPWPVGARVLELDGLDAEVWYPGKPGSEAGLGTKRYDVRDWLPDSEKTKIPDADNPWQESTAYADLPIDDQHGPYPVVVFVHGTAGWRTQSLAQVEHWASRGFVVIAADHPGLYLGDLLALKTMRDLAGDIGKMVAAIAATSSGLQAFADRIDATRLGMVGHSAGGGAIQDQASTPFVRVLIPLAAGGVAAGASLESTLVMGGKVDSVVSYGEQQTGYESSPPKKRLVGIEGAGHLFPTDLCHLSNSLGENLVEIAQKYQITNAQFASVLFDCPASEPPADRTRAIVSFATATVLEETLHCQPGVGFSDFATRYPEVSELREDP